MTGRIGERALRTVAKSDEGSDISFEDERWGPAMFAVVAHNPAVIGIARQWQAATRFMGLRTDVFASRQEAVAWLAGSDLD